MNGARTSLIIAIFGGDDKDAVERAYQLGAIIAERSHILLTGGTQPGSSTVKESAIAGVGSSSWIGVGRGDKIDAAYLGNGFVIYTDLGHKRNYLEACLCDAAIGLAGGEGTISEVTFSLSLQRPVAFVGDFWKRFGPLEDCTKSPGLTLMIDSTFTRVGNSPSGNHHLDDLLNEHTIRKGLEKLPPHKYLMSSDNLRGVIDWIEKEFVSCEKKGNFPQLEGYEQVITKYQEWILRRTDK